ncbi:MAG: efflux RND transporter periplasmic adaptor subunit [Acidobacteriaceae bacterium]|nr:efflux RND transporter periplasmic adaptor subunit [Acidobacteriaceae bacterium]
MTLRATGNLIADETAQVALNVNGKVIALPVNTGSRVEKGTVLVEIDPSDYQLRLQQAQSAEAQALLTLRQAEGHITLEKNQTYDPTKQNSVLVVLANLRSAQERAQNAHQNVQRYQNLFRTGDVSQAAVDNAHQQALISDTQVASAEAQYKAELATAKTAMESVSAARANYESARASVDLAERSLAGCKVRSPIAGYLLTRPLNLGEFASTGTVAATVIRTRPILMDAFIPEGQEAQIKPGNAVSIEVPSYSDHLFWGSVQYLSPEVNTASRSVIARVAIKNSNGLLRPGMFATAEISVAQRETALFIPAAAINKDNLNGTAMVFVLQGDRVQARIVRSGEVQNGQCRIYSGLQTSDQIAIPVKGTLNDGAAVVRSQQNR